MSTDTKLIEVTGGTVTAGVSEVSVTRDTFTPNTNASVITNGELTASVLEVSITRDISTPTISASVITPLVSSSEITEHKLNVVVTGLGEENIPDARLFKFLSERFGLNEQTLAQVFKSLNNLTATEDQVRKLLEKALADITTNSDVFNRVWAAFRTHTDSTSNTEQLEKDFDKVLADLVNAPDLVSTALGKYLADVTALANLSYAVILVAKSLQDETLGFSDVVDKIVEFNRTVADTVFTSDDFFGSANIDDDQYADVYKVVLNWVNPTETFAVSVDKPDVLDQAASSEQAYLHSQIPKTSSAFLSSEIQSHLVGLTKLEQVLTSQELAVDVNKPDRVDQTTTEDQHTMDLNKPDVFDQATQQDQVANTVERYSADEFTVQNEEYSVAIEKADRIDTAATSDDSIKHTSKTANSDKISIAELILSKLIGLNINEIDYFLEDYVFDITDYTFKAVHARDQITQIELAKQVEELVDATDDFFGAANIDDDQIALVDKVLVEYATFSEAFDRLVSYIRLFAETAILLEQVELGATKVVADQTANTELVYFDTFKAANHQAITSETQVFDVLQTSLDQVLGSEQIALAASTVYTDQTTTLDQVVKFYEAVRIFTELTQTTEQVEQLIEQVSAEQVAFSELVTQTVAKLTLDQTTNTEQLAFDFFGVYSELVDATDDFFGSANIDDDQIALVDKVLVEHIATTESITTVAEFYRTFLEIAIVTDLATFSFAKSVLNSVAVSETVAFSFETLKAETAVIQETVQQSFETSRTETATQTDLFTQSIEPAKFETVSTAEAFNYAASLEKPETVVVSETVESETTTQRTEITSILELFIAQWTAVKSFTEIVLQTDIVSLAADKPDTETVATSELQTFDATIRPLDVAATAETIGKDTITELSDLVDATDDFFGAANIDDDQIAVFDKVLADHTTSGDTVTTLTEFLRSVNESQILSEVFAAAINKALSDINNSSDTVTLLTAPVKLEAVSTSQTISLTLQSYFSQDYVELGYTGETYTY